MGPRGPHPPDESRLVTAGGPAGGVASLTPVSSVPRFAVFLIAGAIALTACDTASSEVTRAAVPESTTSTSAVAPPPTEGKLRARVSGIGTEPAPDDVLLVGDSVMVLVADDIAVRVSSELHVDAADCRRIDMDVQGPCGAVPSGTVVADGVEALADQHADLASRGITPDVAVVILANNSSLSAERLDAAMAAVPDVPRVWWVTTRIDGFGRQDPNNAALAALAERDPRARVIDWYEASEDEDWLADHVHPNDDGQRALGRLVARHVACDCVP